MTTRSTLVGLLSLTCGAVPCLAQRQIPSVVGAQAQSSLSREAVVSECRAREGTASVVSEAERDLNLAVFPSRSSQYQYTRSDTLREIDTALLEMFLLGHRPVWKVSVGPTAGDSITTALCRRRRGSDSIIEVFRVSTQGPRGPLLMHPWSGLTTFTSSAVRVARDSMTLVTSRALPRRATDGILRKAATLSAVLRGRSSRLGPAWVFVFADSNEMAATLPFMGRATAATFPGLSMRPTFAWAQYDRQGDVDHELVHVVTAPWLVEFLHSGQQLDAQALEGLAEGMSGETAGRIRALGGGRDSAALGRGVRVLRERMRERLATLATVKVDRYDPTWSDWLGMHYVAIAAACRPFPQWVLRTEWMRDAGTVVRATAAALSLSMASSDSLASEGLDERLVAALVTQGAVDRPNGRPNRPSMTRPRPRCIEHSTR